MRAVGGGAPAASLSASAARPARTRRSFAQVGLVAARAEEGAALQRPQRGQQALADLAAGHVKDVAVKGRRQARQRVRNRLGHGQRRGHARAAVASGRGRRGGRRGRSRSSRSSSGSSRAVKLRPFEVQLAARRRSGGGGAGHSGAGEHGAAS